MNCPDCGGPMWDNRAKKASGVYKPTSPDYSCKDRDGCGKGVWLEPKSEPKAKAKSTAAGPGMPSEASEVAHRIPEPKTPATEVGRDTQLLTLYDHCFAHVLKLANQQNALVGTDGINLTSEDVMQGTATLYIARSRLIA